MTVAVSVRLLRLKLWTGQLDTQLVFIGFNSGQSVTCGLSMAVDLSKISRQSATDTKCTVATDSLLFVDC